MTESSNSESQRSSPVDPAPDFHRLHDAAMAFTGLSDFGEPSYREGMNVLLHSYDNNSNQLPECRTRCEGNIIGALVGRLLSEAAWKRYPQVLNLPIKAPIIITGLPRTGTTALHKLLAVDPQFQGLELWLGNSPTPRPPRSEWASRPDFLAAKGFLEDLYARLPRMRAIHEIFADLPEEDWTPLTQDFAGLMLMENAHVPEFETWVEHEFRADTAYRRFANNLRLIGSNDPHRRWVIKDPIHLMFMESVLDNFPDATIIQTHRNPVRSIPSMCSLVWLLRGYFENPDNDPKLIGKRQLAQWSMALDRTRKVRNARPQRFLDVSCSRIADDPIAVVNQIYDFCGLRLEPGVEKSMRAWIENNKKGKHGEHRYDLETFGLAESEIANTFAEYLADYELARD